MHGDEGPLGSGQLFYLSSPIGKNNGTNSSTVLWLMMHTEKQY